MGLRSNSSGITGSAANVHLPRFLSISLGKASSTRWPMAEEMTYWSFSNDVVLALEAAKGPGEIGCHAGFFGDDECFGHGAGGTALQTSRT